jgi:hypothetical protein
MSSLYQRAVRTKKETSRYFARLATCKRRISIRSNSCRKRAFFYEGYHEPKKYTIAEIIEMKALYRAKVRELKKANQLELEEA